MRARAFTHPSRNVGVAPAIRSWGRPRIPGRYRVAEAIGGTVTPGRTLSRAGAIHVFQHFAKGF